MVTPVQSITLTFNFPDPDQGSANFFCKCLYTIKNLIASICKTIFCCCFSKESLQQPSITKEEINHQVRSAIDSISSANISETMRNRCTTFFTSLINTYEPTQAIINREGNDASLTLSSHTYQYPLVSALEEAAPFMN